MYVKLKAAGRPGQDLDCQSLTVTRLGGHNLSVNRCQLTVDGGRQVDTRNTRCDGETQVCIGVGIDRGYFDRR